MDTFDEIDNGTGAAGDGNLLKKVFTVVRLLTLDFLKQTEELDSGKTAGRLQALLSFLESSKSRARSVYLPKHLPGRLGKQR